MPEIKTITALLATLTIDGQQALFVMASSDGSINRLGTGAENNTDRDMFIGKTDPEVFHILKSKITPELLNWCGRSLADPNPVGKICELTIGFKDDQGKESMIAFRYGTKSQGPPPEVCEFIVGIVRGTDSWHESQKTMVRGAKDSQKKPFWKFW